MSHTSLPVAGFRHFGPLILFFCLLNLTALAFEAEGTAYGAERTVAEAWRPLILRLAEDGVTGEGVDRLFSTLPQVPTQSPMGRKMVALYQKTFFPKPAPKPTDYYKGVVTQENAKRCADYLERYHTAFEAADQKYGVPPEIATALLFVETRLGDVLADVPENAFYTLASMATTKSPQDIPNYLRKMRGHKKRLKWIEKTMVQRAEWAYKETRALVVYMLENGIEPHELPSSIYGAIGLCQFMPSNISLYAEDGNGDGRIDLFDINDAAMSLARYLNRHGWNKGCSRAVQHAMLMKYNHSKVYANTILALSDLIACELNSR